MSQSRSPDRKIADIQVLRGISILLVLAHHCSLMAYLFGYFSKQVKMPFYLGVELFFIISGYVVTKSLMKDEFNAWRFVIKRVFRLLPATVLFLGFSYLVISFVRLPGVPENFKRIFDSADSAFLEQALGIVSGYFIVIAGQSPPVYSNGAMWSLSVEDQFYATIAVISLLAIVSRRLTRIPAKWWVGAASAFLFFALFRFRMQVLLGKSFFELKPRFVPFLLQYNYDFLPLGVLLALFDSARSGWIARRFNQVGPALTGYLLVVPLACVAVCDSPVDPHLRARFLVGFALPLAAVCFSALVLLAGNQCAFPSSRGRIYCCLEFFGNRSFSYYLFNFPVLAVVSLLIWQCPAWLVKNPWRIGLVEIALTAIVLAPIVELIYRYVEMPLTRVGKRLVDKDRLTPDKFPAPAGGSNPIVIPIAGNSAKAA